MNEAVFKARLDNLRAEAALLATRVYLLTTAAMTYESKQCVKRIGHLPNR